MARAKMTDEEQMLVQEDVQEETVAEMEEVYFPPVRSREEENFQLVIVNGKRYQIMKGERVMVPKEVAEVIRNREREQYKFAQRMLERNS